MFLKEAFVVLAAVAVIHASDPDWWKNAVIYQIYPRSFKDSNNDGIGDLQGIISKLDHLKDAGITATWLSPIMKSPQVDQGYDISDYYSIEPEYGTLKDFKELIEKANELGIKIIMDFVPNHTSDQHEWFKKSVAREAGYEDFYVWNDGIPDPNGNGRLPPNNWLSAFEDSAWAWNEERQQFYLHQFAPEQVDLNYRNPAVVKAMENVMLYWLDQGVAGFRVDAVNFVFEDELLRDEPKAEGEWRDNDYRSLDHIYTLDQNETFNMVYDWREMFDNYTAANGGDTRIFITEAYTTPEKTFLFYGLPDGSRLGAHFSFNFDFITILNETSTAQELKDIIDKWQTQLPKIYTPNWVLGNHDQHRVGSRFGAERIDGMNMLASILPGVQITYNGEEIGMLNGNVTCEEGQDPKAIKNCTTFDELTRDFERTPFQWDSSTNAGFNEGNKTWLPVSELYLTTNLEDQTKSYNVSHYRIYQALLEIKKYFLTPDTDLESHVRGENVLEVVRGNHCTSGLIPDVVLLYNLNQVEETVDILSEEYTDYVYVYVSSVGSQYASGDIISRKGVTLAAGEGLIVTVECPA